MLSDKNHTITLRNYEEYFILYVDNELDASQKAMVESFAAQHPQLAGELDALMNTKLPLEEVSFAGKEDLLSPAMKLNSVDESLLLYIDDELLPAEKAVVAGRIETDAAYALQHSLLLQTKLNAAETVSYPDKKELYRHEREVVPFTFWMRMAAAVILLLIGTWFFFLNKGGQPDGSLTSTHQPVNNHPVIDNKPTILERVTKPASPKDETVLAKPLTAVPVKKEGETAKQKVRTVPRNNASSNEDAVAYKRSDVIHLDAARFTAERNITPVIAVSKTFTPASVTSKEDSSYNKQNSPTNDPEVVWAVDEKKTPARGFFRKVSRFIERKAGIGTVNADNELLIGAVAVKLK